jgi:hypothetical protein
MQQWLRTSPRATAQEFVLEQLLARVQVWRHGAYVNGVRWPQLPGLSQPGALEVRTLCGLTRHHETIASSASNAELVVCSEGWLHNQRETES